MHTITMINSQLPEFSLKAYHDGKFKTVTHNDLLGRWSILFFYPADFSFVCPTELIDLSEKYDIFQSMHTDIYSVSTDSHFVHRAWHMMSEEIRKIRYAMLADPSGHLCKAFRVLKEDEGVAYRGTFIIDPQGKIKIAELNDNSIGRDADELLRKLQAAQFTAAHPDQVCPAKWKEGDETITPTIDLVGKI